MSECGVFTVMTLVVSHIYENVLFQNEYVMVGVEG